jgi:non-ribosomal peptide synthase protein (TIGR01720 family)
VKEVAAGTNTIPIGRPISNTTVYILDGYMEPVPVGVSGELYIGGAGLSSGYVGDAALTVEKYVPNPFSGTEGDRMYRTGDLCRYLSDGSIEFIGRVDHQVKLRGFRIELGEIESVLGRHELVRESVVLYREDEPGEKRLVAYVVLERGSELGVTELRGYLSEKLPEYMIPSRYVMLESLPLTSSGKVDRLSLPAPEGLDRELESSYVEPRTEVEEKLAGIWSQVLGVERIGIHDNFFELGGDSILAIQIIARANEGGMRFTPKQLFEKQTIAELSGEVGGASAVECDQGIVEGEVPLTPIQRWFFERGLLKVEHFNQAFMLEVGRRIETDLLELAIEGLVLHHDALRLRFEREGSVWRQFNAGPEAVVPLSRMDLSGMSESEQERLIESGISELQAGLDLRDGPILGAILFDLGEERGRRLLLVIHHLAVDVVSWRILLEDLWTGYEQLSRGESVRLPAKTTSFKRWSERLMAYGESEEVRGELEYWLSESRFAVGSLPVDHELVEGANTVGSTGTVTMSLSVEETRDLLQEVPKAYRTQITEVLLTALSMSFAGWTGSQLQLVDVEGHGREELFDEVDLSRTVGWFTSMYPLLLDLGEAQGPGEAIKRIKEQVRGVPNHGIGYGVLRYLSGDADVSDRLRAMPKAEVSFNYLGQLDQTLRESSPFERVIERIGPSCDPREARAHIIEVMGLTTGGSLRLRWSYSKRVHTEKAIQNLAERYVKELGSLISHCLSPEARGHTPSDFPEANLSQEELDEIVADLRGSAEQDRDEQT